MNNISRLQAEHRSNNQDKSNWELMIAGIVRPPKAKYTNAQLSHRFHTLSEKQHTRSDYSVDHKGKKIDLTVYDSFSLQYPQKYVILYMHGNSSCRLEAVGLIKHIPEGISLASFDFMGCGNNVEEETISLGYREAEQAKSATEFLRSLGYRVILWGRSMGAATALLYGDAEFIVADSSFKSFKSLCKQVAKQHSPRIIPNCMINCVFPCVFTKIKTDVSKKANYDVEDLDVKNAVTRLNPDTIVVFMSGNNDVLINKRNSEKLYTACPSKRKYIKLFDGDHNSKRPDQVVKEIMEIIQEHVKQNQPQIRPLTSVAPNHVEKQYGFYPYSEPEFQLRPQQPQKMQPFSFSHSHLQ